MYSGFKIHKPRVIYDPQEGFKFEGPQGEYAISYSESYKIREFSVMAEVAEKIGVDVKDLMPLLWQIKLPEYPPIDISSLKEMVSNPKMNLVDKFNLLRHKSEVLRGFLREKLRKRLFGRLKKETFDDPP